MDQLTVKLYPSAFPDEEKQRLLWEALDLLWQAAHSQGRIEKRSPSEEKQPATSQDLPQEATSPSLPGC